MDGEEWTISIKKGLREATVFSPSPIKVVTNTIGIKKYNYWCSVKFDGIHGNIYRLRKTKVSLLVELGSMEPSAFLQISRDAVA